MLISDLPLLKMAKEKMDWTVQRHRVLAQNVANANTPSYRAQDLKKLDFRGALRNEQSKMSLNRTSENHFDVADVVDNYQVRSDDRPYEVSPDGNTVALEDQIVKMTDNVSDQRIAATIHRRIVALYRIALGRGGA